MRANKNGVISIMAILLITTGMFQIFLSSNSVKANIDTSKVALVQNSNIGQGFYSPNQRLYIPNKFSRTDTASFFKEIKQGAIDTWSKHNFLSSVTAAQAALESGWGTSELTGSANNLFGIKGKYNGQSVTYPTQEWVNGHYITINDEFRKYPSWSVSVEDHGNFFTDNSRYHNLLGLTDYKQVARLVQQDGYATDPSYADKLISIIEQYNLGNWDKEAQETKVNKGNLDELVMNGNTIHLRGWSISGLSNTQPYSYLFALDAKTGKELTCWKLHRIQRPDVQKVYPNVSNSLNSGFDETYTIPDSIKGHKVKFMVRYSSVADGNSGKVDYIFKNEVNLPANFNRVSINDFIQEGDTIHVRGWHLANYVEKMPYRYVFLIDKNTNAEYTRMKISNIKRPDVASVYPQYNNAVDSGFDIRFPVLKQMKNKDVYIIARYTSDPSGNGPNYINNYVQDKTIHIK